ncbi:MAG: outer membrane protein assembly factor [Bacteroidales bacterium]|nr:outer membrane protein assembly factor [Bacteroidales bacterium]
MKKHLLIALALLLSVSAFSQKKEIIKKGWNFGPLPVLGFDSDLGFQYGACVDIFNFGDGTNYPRYNYKFNVEVSRYTKGSGVFRFYSDMPLLIKDTKLFFDLTYNYSKKFEFFGFNGYEAGTFDPNLFANEGVEGYKSGYHFIKRNTLRFVGSMQRSFFGVPNLNWVAGLAYYHVATDKISLEAYEGQETLYTNYVNAGIIKDNEKNGGNIAQLRLGLIYDSRDHNSDPSKGIYAEYTLTGSSDFIDGNGYNALMQTFIWRQYIPIYRDKLTFAYRLGVQHKIAGENPWYMINNINTPFFQKMYTEGLGGVVTMRGVNRNGVLGDGFVLGNAELRWYFLDFQFINQNWQLAFCPFFDAGMVIQKFREDEMIQAQNAYAATVPEGQKVKDLYYSGEKEKPHMSAGAGIKLIMNRNMILAVDAGRALNPVDGEKFKIFVGFNYIF